MNTDNGREFQLHLVVGAARSGTTLLRLLLDAHPDIGSPAEANIPALIQHLVGVWWTVTATQDHKAADSPPPAPHDQFASLPDAAKQAICAAVSAPVEHYCRRWGKRAYCDKSLTSVHYLEQVHELFPDARYVLLFRNVMDTVASGIEASPWGFQQYGYLPYVQRSPDNFVAALATYWLAHVSPALEWEKAHPDLCIRMRYEDLVTAPESAARTIFHHLGFDHDPAALEGAFEKARTTVGPGDHKVTYTSAVHENSIGHGKAVPVNMIPPPLRESLNERLEELGYEPLSPGWNAQPAASGPSSGNPWGKRLHDLVEATKIRDVAPHNGDLGSFAVVAQDDEQLRWVVDPRAGEIRQGDGEVEHVVIGTTEALTLMLSGEANVGVLLRSGRVRHLTPRGNGDAEGQAHIMNAVVDLFRDRHN